MKTNQIMIYDRNVPYHITYSARKTLSIRIDLEGNLEVKAPKRLSEHEIRDFLKEKQKWIEKQLHKNEKRMSEPPLFQWKDGELLPIYGSQYRLEVIYQKDSKRDCVQFCNAKIQIITNDVQPQNVKEAVSYWYKKACKKLFEQKVMEFAAIMNVSFAKITLKEQKTCWGSCSNKQNLNFNWKLLLMPPEIMDYVIVHELTHLKEMNHSKRFWERVEAVLPDYKIRRKWLKDNGGRFI